MNMKTAKICLLCLVWATTLDRVSAADKLSDQAQEAMKKSTAFLRSISTQGGYVGIYSLDLKERYGEAKREKAEIGEIWVQPPGTPSVGKAYLRGYTVTGDKYYYEAARQTALALAWGQRQAGGWDHRVDVSHRTPHSNRVVRNKGQCSFDDNISQEPLSFLIQLDKHLDEPWLTEAIDVALDFFLEAQFDNGAWSQWYPLRGKYHDYYTFNDGAINDCIRVLLEAYKAYGNQKYLNAAKRAGEFIIASQLPSPQAGWAQQYSHDLKPAWARAFEPPAVCTLATAKNIRTLVDLYLVTKDAALLQPIPAAIDWLNRSQIGDRLWARLYELDTNKPIYGDRDEKVHYTLEELSDERRYGYGWQGDFNIPDTIEYYQSVIKLGTDKYLAKQSRPIRNSRRKRLATSLENQVEHVIAQLDEKGRWTREDTFTSGDFVENFNLLCDYLELLKTR